MQLTPSSQHQNQWRNTDPIPERFRNLVITGSIQQCWVSPAMQLFSQQIIHPEFDLYIHYITCKGRTELFGKTFQAKRVWVMQQEGSAEVSQAGSPPFAVKANQHFFMQAGTGKENRFRLEKGRSAMLLIAVKPAGEKMIRQFYPDLWQQLQRTNGNRAVYSSGYIEHFYREELCMPLVAAPLIHAFLSQRFRILLLLFSQQLLDAPSHSGIADTPDQKVILAKQLLDQQPGESWTVYKLAQRTGWNTQDLKVAFKRVYRTTPIRYLRKVRLQFALMLVSSTTKTIAEVAHACGFKRPHHFIRVFKAFMGKTPGSFRKSGSR